VAAWTSGAGDRARWVGRACGSWARIALTPSTHEPDRRLTNSASS